jgi:SAM-dependent methyltransferase
MRRGYKIYRCKSCQHLFVWPIPANIRPLYSTDYSGVAEGFRFVDSDRDKEPKVFTFERYLDLLNKYSPGNGSILDVGAATGFFLNLARQRGWETYGVEPSDYAAGLGRKKGIKIKTGVLEKSDFRPNSFDAVTLWDRIEHLPEPGATLQTIKRTLKRGGVLAINTPDSGSVLAATMRLNWYQVAPPEHINLFHRNSLRTLLESYGFEVLTVESIGKRFTMQYAFQKLAHWSGSGVSQQIALRLASLSIGKLGVSINLFDNMVVCARKVSW